MTHEEASPIVAIGYATTIIALGGSWWRALIVAACIGIVFAMGWAPQWIVKGLLVLGFIASLVFLQAIPPPAEWNAAAKSIAALIRGRG